MPNRKSTALALSLVLSAGIPAYAETYRLETLVNGQGTCKFELSEASWKDRLADGVREIVTQIIEYEEVRDQGDIKITDIDDNRVELSKTYAGWTTDSSGRKSLYEVFEVKGIAFRGKEKIFIKINGGNSPMKSLMTGGLVPCTPVSLPKLPEIPLETLRAMEIGRTRNYEIKMGNVLDSGTGQALKMISNETGPLKYVTNPIIDQNIQEQKRARAEAISNGNLSDLERYNATQVEIQHYLDNTK